jgi:hypothetical protein
MCIAVNVSNKIDQEQSAHRFDADAQMHASRISQSMQHFDGRLRCAVSSTQKIFHIKGI